MLEAGILEPYLVKHWGIKMATNAAITVLRVDQVCIQILTAHNSNLGLVGQEALSAAELKFAGKHDAGSLF